MLFRCWRPKKNPLFNSPISRRNINHLNHCVDKHVKIMNEGGCQHLVAYFKEFNRDSYRFVNAYFSACVSKEARRRKVNKLSRGQTDWSVKLIIVLFCVFVQNFYFGDFGRLCPAYATFAVDRVLSCTRVCTAFTLPAAVPTFWTTWQHPSTILGLSSVTAWSTATIAGTLSTTGNARRLHGST